MDNPNQYQSPAQPSPRGTSIGTERAVVVVGAPAEGSSAAPPDSVDSPGSDTSRGPAPSQTSTESAIGSRCDSDLVRMALEQARGRGRRPKRTESLPTDAFPGYHLVRELHRGGQGVIYQALHTQTKRKVAIKVMREGPFVGVKERVRFEREIEILGSLNHPNVVAIHDSGLTSLPGSVPPVDLHYFVMDYVSGQPLDAWARQPGRGGREVLDLFAKLCDAVGAAHLRGVIHRDLKPSNIRVDSSNEPHVLDFGLAKTGGAEPTDVEGTPPQAHVMTVTGQFVGTPAWASPEQAEGNLSALDVRTDIYSLGVILFHLLTGAFPYPVVGSQREVLDRIVRVTPTWPSEPNAGTLRGVDDEVRTIVNKCLAKERQRRYQSASELARDVRNYLEGRPIEAKGDSTWYVIRKRLHRHAVPVAAAATVLVTMLGAGVFSAVAWRTAEGNYAVAERERARADTMLGFAQGFITGVSADIAQGSDTTLLAEILHDRAAAITPAVQAKPELASGMHDLVGVGYMRIGDYERAATHLDLAADFALKAFGAGDPRTATIRVHAAQVGALIDTPASRGAAITHAREARAVLERALGPTSQAVADASDALGEALKKNGDYTTAKAEYTRALTIRLALNPPRPADVAESYSNLGELAFDLRQYDEAVALQREQLRLRHSLREREPARVATAKQSLAAALDKADPSRAAEVETLFTESIAELAALVGRPDHPYLMAAKNKYALFLRDTCGKIAESEALFRDVYLGRKHTLRPGNANLIASKNNLAWTLSQLKRFDECARLLDEGAVLGPNLSPAEWRTHWRWVQNTRDWALHAAAQGDAKAAGQLAARATERFETVVDRPVSPDNQDRLDKLRASLEQMNRALGRSHPGEAPAGTAPR